MNFFVINNQEGINKEFWIESNHDILSCLMYHNIRIHGAKAGIELQLHVVIADGDNKRFFVIFPNQNCSPLNGIQKFFFVDGHFCLIVAGKHLADTEIFSFNQTGDNDGIVKFKENMIGAEIDQNLLLIVPA